MLFFSLVHGGSKFEVFCIFRRFYQPYLLVRRNASINFFNSNDATQYQSCSQALWSLGKICWKWSFQWISSDRQATLNCQKIFIAGKVLLDCKTKNWIEPTVWPEPIWKKVNTTTASKYIPKRPRICINWNTPFQTQIYLVKVPLNVKIVKQDLLNKKQFLKILWSEVWKKGIQLMQILSLLGMYFDAVVVKVEKSLILFQIGSGHTVW